MLNSPTLPMADKASDVWLLAEDIESHFQEDDEEGEAGDILLTGPAQIAYLNGWGRDELG